MKKRRGLALTLALILAFGTGVVAKETFDVIKAQLRPDFVIEIDGVEREFKNAQGEVVYPVLYDGTTYLPLRAISEIMGKTVYWYENEKRIEIKDEKKKDLPTVTDADIIVADDTQKDKDKNKDKDKVKEEIDLSAFIGEEKAKEIALEKAQLKAEDVKFIKVELDKERGVAVYEVEFNYGLKEYSAEIKADDGTIVEWDVEFDD